jgi:hypothetical protein
MAEPATKTIGEHAVPPRFGPAGLLRTGDGAIGVTTAGHAETQQSGPPRSTLYVRA